ncbi:hypothetical protein ACFPYJ_11995 [Paenibacillus solisilvae]|uniref:YhfM-like domain-containing protein n=1 Tax=Paenibacillus solisilvae TaxID=2486751 RepID=A0ABW0W0A2_9BACL
MRKSVTFRPLLLIMLGLVLGLVGCQAENEKGAAGVSAGEIEHISLTCIDICLRWEKPPFTLKTFNDADSILTFTEAINQARRMEGDLDYGGIFNMKLFFTDGTRKEYVLNIDDKVGSTGLLVDIAKSTQGYIIGQDMVSKLRAIIFPA